MSAIVLPARCDRTAVEALLPELIAEIGDAPLAIDGRAVERAGAALLQLLVSARRTGQGAVIETSPALAEAIRLAGLEHELCDAPRAGAAT